MEKQYFFNIKKNKLKEKLSLISIAFLFLSSCSPTPSNTTPPPVAAPPEIVSIAGGAVAVEASEDIVWLNTQEILDNADNPVKDGSIFIVTGSADVQVSIDGTNFFDSVRVSSSQAQIRFAVRPPTQVGSYKVSVTQAAKQQKSATGFFYIDVRPTNADQLGTITSSRFEDEFPYDGIKQDSEKYSVLADGQTSVQLFVGPIIDKFGNSLNKGYIRLITDKGQITSENPVIVSDGFVVFNYTPSNEIGPVNIKAQAVDEQAGVILKEITGVIHQVTPDLVFTTSGDMGEVSTNQNGDMLVTLLNNGTTSATNLNLRTILPFSLPTADTDCPSQLRPGESCELRVRIYSSERGLKQSEIQVSALPATFSENVFRFPVKARIVAPANLTLSTDNFGFGPVSCGDTVQQEFWVKNTGESDATDFTITQPSALNEVVELSCAAKNPTLPLPINQTQKTLVLNQAKSDCATVPKCRWSSLTNTCTNRYYDVFLAQPDSASPADPNAVMNCGNVIPAGGRKCRVYISYNPMTLLSNQSVTARVQASGLDSVPIVLSGGAGIGNPSGDIPISVNPGFLGLSSQASVNLSIGPVKDPCGNKVDNNTPWQATVSSGSISSNSGFFVDGISSINWDGTSDISKMGPQTFSLTTRGLTVNKTINFSGSILSITGNEDLGAIAAELPVQKQWTITNNGNLKATNIVASFSNLQNVSVSGIDSSACIDLNPGSSCIVQATFTPVILTGTTSPFSGKIDISASGYGQLQTSMEFKGFGSQLITLNNGSINYSLGTSPAGVGTQREITIKSLISRTAMSFSFINSPSSNWSFSNINCGTSITANSTCKFKINYSNADTLAGTKTAQFKIASTQGDTIVNLALDIVGNMQLINPVIQVQSDRSSMLADGVSTANITVGPIKDQYNNILPAGVKVIVSVDKGSIIEAQPLVTNSQGMLTATLKSSDKEVGKASVRAEVVNSSPQSQGFAFVTYTGVYLTYSVSEINFGEVGMGFSADMKVLLKNLGNIEATAISFNSNDSSVYGLIDLGTCASGSIPADGECELTVRFSAPAIASKAEILGSITATSSVPTGTNESILNLRGTSLLPATLVAEARTISLQLVPDSVYAIQVKLTNIGDATLRNFAIGSNRPNLTVSSYESCLDLVGGASCEFTLTFNSTGITSAFSSIITATGDNTSAQINFTSDYLRLAFINEHFTDDVLTCHPVQIQAQDLASNPMNVQSSILVSLTGSRQGTFYRSKTCSGTTLSRVGLYQNNTTTDEIYYMPKVAGKHILSATSGDVVGTQENLANLVIRPGKVVTGSPLQPIEFTAIGANGNVSCEFVLDSSGDGERQGEAITSSGKTCLYKAGEIGEVTDQILLFDQDSPPNTAALQVTTTKAISINPTSIFVDSGEQVLFNSINGSKTGYVYSITPNASDKKIGSTIFNNLYTAGQNITDSENLQETVTVTDSFGAKATASVFVRKSIFNQQQVISAPSNGLKSIAVWKNVMVVGDPSATATGGISGAGQVHIYKKRAINSTKNQWDFVRTIESPDKNVDGHFGKKVGLHEKHLVVSAPDERGLPGISKGGAVYYFQIDAGGNELTFNTKECPSSRDNCKPSFTDTDGSEQYLVSKTGNKFLKILSDPTGGVRNNDAAGEVLSITENFISVGSQRFGGELQVYRIDSMFKPVTYRDLGSSCKWKFFPCPESEVPLNAGFPASVSIYSNQNYGGTYIAMGYPEFSLLGKQNLGRVDVYRRVADPNDPGSDPQWIAAPIDSGHISRLPNNADTNPDFQANMKFGSSVSMFGPYLAVGSPGANGNKGKVYVYRRDPLKEDNNWSIEVELNAQNYNGQINNLAGFGSSVALFGNYLLVGAPRENNYNNLFNSGSFYVFQRYLSEDNKWEFLGQIRATNYASDHLFGSSVALYANDFFSTSKNSDGGVYYYTGGKNKNIWPFGYHGQFNSLTNYEQPSGSMRDWSSFFLQSGLKYIVSPRGKDAKFGWGYLGVAGEMRINGIIESRNAFWYGNYQNAAPDESGFLNGKPIEYNVTQKAGGRGAGGGMGFNDWWIQGFDYAIDDREEGCSGTANLAQGDPGQNQVDGFGGGGGAGFGGVRSYGRAMDSVDLGYSFPGKGGERGYHGIPLYIKSDTIIGTGAIDTSGGFGLSGLSGRNRICRQQGPTGHGGHYYVEHGCCGGCWDDGENIDYEQWYGVVCSGAGGPGGGGAGGSGAAILLDVQAESGLTYYIGSGIGGGTTGQFTSRYCGWGICRESPVVGSAGLPGVCKNFRNSATSFSSSNLGSYNNCAGTVTTENKSIYTKITFNSHICGNNFFAVRFDSPVKLAPDFYKKILINGQPIIDSVDIAGAVYSYSRFGEFAGNLFITPDTSSSVGRATPGVNFSTAHTGFSMALSASAAANGEIAPLDIKILPGLGIGPNLEQTDQSHTINITPVSAGCF